MNDSMTIVSPVAFKWILTILTFAMAGSWLVYDAITLVRTRKMDRTSAVNRDKQFGMVIGVIIGIIGVWGCLRFHGVV